MKTIDLTYKRYNELVLEGNVDDQDYSDWYNQNVYLWLRVAKRKYNQDYIEVKTKKGIEKITYKEWFGDE